MQACMHEVGMILAEYTSFYMFVTLSRSMSKTWIDAANEAINS